MTSSKWLRVLGLLVLVLSSSGATQPLQARSLAAPGIGPKHLAGAATELAAMRLPDPRDIGTQSTYALHDVRFSVVDRQKVWTRSITVDGTGKLSLALVSATSKSWQVSVRLPSGEEFRLTDLIAKYQGTQQTSSLGWQATQAPAELYMFQGVPLGVWQLRIVADASATDGFVMVTPETTHGLYTYLDTTKLVAGQPVGFGAFIFADTRATDQTTVGPVRKTPQPLRDAKLKAEITIYDPNGRRINLTRADNGLQGDAKAQDGLLGMRLPALASGMYRAQVRVSGTLANGTLIERTNEQIFPILDAVIDRIDQPTSRVIDSKRLGLSLPIQTRTLLPAQLLVYAEVWGTSAKGQLIPVSWLSTMATPTVGPDGRPQVGLEFDSRWLALAGASAPLVLRQVRMQDPDTFVPLSTAAELALPVAKLPSGAFAERQRINPNDPELLMGRQTAPAARSAAQTNAVKPIQFRSALPSQPAPSVQQQAGRALFLVHGYCSGRVWPTGDFNDGPTASFSDIGQNRSNNEFALMIAEQGQRVFPNGFGVVAHSQGGVAAVHLYTYYWSGLDWTSAPRRIQSLGSPYSGTPLAGLIAWIGTLFGGCGANFDLTHFGAALWQSGVPWWARSQTYYELTTHWRWWIFDGICHASSFVLAGADDGVVEEWAAHLPGAHFTGQRDEWCHNGGMVHSPQYEDSGRNNQMDMWGR